MNPIRVTLQLGAASANLYATSQTPTSGTALTLTGSTPDVARRVLLTYGNEGSARTMAITGTDRNGNTISETLSVPSGASGTVYTLQDFLTVTRALPLGGGWTAAVTLGTNGVASTQWFQRDWVNLSHLGVLGYVASGKVVTYNIEATLDDYNAPLDAAPYYASTEPASANPPIAIPFAGMSGLTTTTPLTEITVPCFGFRLTITAGTDPATMQAIESTPWSHSGI